ncbi:high affinity immunoglobulin gamma Fc receptor I-like [Tachysurus fulvidraco]|uniref:high affinity immunoglobulin gamma Fc receptor I-like n=1 Tax=Tachysurus fulvidraco TaxID=1234273 RepID=UPI000F4DB12C|nr:high affinity immunoglobulin gamma Fc receptor I-like [Tachysurus fulvidraco]
MTTMHFFHSFVVFVTWLAVVRLEETQLKAKATVSSGHQQLFSGENVELTCSVPGDPSSSWTYQWFHDGVSLGFKSVYSIKKARVQQSGSYTCQGQKAIRNQPYTQSSVLSDPLKIHVDGGWILLRYSVEQLVIEEPLTLTCRVRDDHLISDVIFYKDGINIKTQKNPDLVFPSLSFEDDGMYSCRATWLKDLDYQSAQSVNSSVAVLDKLDNPRLVLLTVPNQVTVGKQVVFRCITKLNTKEQGSIEYYFNKDSQRLGLPSAKDTYVITRVSKDDAGIYSCKVSVKALYLEKWSNYVPLKV